MAQITWRNINAPDLGDPLAASARGGNQLTKGIDSLRDELTRYQETEQQNWDTVKTNNTNKLLAEVAALQDMQGYNAYRSGLGQRLASMGAQVNANDVWKALNTVDDRIRNDLTAQMTLDDKVRTEAERVAANPYMQQIAGFNSIDQVDNFVKGLSGLEGTENLDLGTLVKAAEARRDDLEGNTTTDQRIESNRLSLNATKDKQAQDELGRKGDAFVGDSMGFLGTDDPEKALRTRIAAWRRQNPDADESTVDGVLERGLARLTNITALTADEQRNLERAQEDFEASTVYTTEKDKDGNWLPVTAAQARKAAVAAQARAKLQRDNLGAVWDPNAVNLSEGELIEQLQGRDDIDNDRFWAWSDNTKEDLPSVVRKTHQYIRAEIPKFADGKFEIPNQVVLEAIRLAGVNDYAGNDKGEIDDNYKKYVQQAWRTWRSKQEQYNTLTDQMNAAEQKLAGVNEFVKQGQRKLADDATDQGEERLRSMAR